MSTENKAISQRQQQAISTKNNIVEAAELLFNETDYEDVKITDICKAAGVSVGSFYNYYSSKEAMIISTISDFDEDLAEFWNSLIEKDISNIKKLHIIASQIACRAAQFSSRRNAQFLRVILKTQTDAYLNNMRAIDKYVGTLLASAVETGELAIDVELDEAVVSLMRLVRGLVFDWTLRGGTFDVVDQTDKAVDHFLKPYYPKNSISDQVPLM